MTRAGVSPWSRIRVHRFGSARAVAGLLTCLWVFALGALPLGSAGLAQTVDDGFWVTNGPVIAAVRDGGTLYIGGSFSRISPPCGNGVPLDASTGTPVPSFPAVTGGQVYAVAPDGAGGWFIGGGFVTVGGVARANLAHIGSDMSVLPWDPGSDGVVVAIAVSGSTVYVGGVFTSVGGQSRSQIAALDATTGLATAWNPTADYTVRTLAVSGATIYAGGDFTNIGGQLRNYIAALDATSGLATAWNPTADQPVRSLAVIGTSIYAGGDFTHIGGQFRNHIGAVDATSGLATAWDPNANSQVLSVVASGSIVYAGGYFTTIGGQSRGRLAALDATSGLALGWDPSPNYDTRVIAVSGTTVYAAGDFTSIGGRSRNGLAALDAATGIATTWNPDPNRAVSCIAVSGSTVYVGGNFTGLGGVVRNNIAALDATTGVPTNWDPNAAGQVDALAVGPSYVYAAGTPSTISGQPRTFLAQIEKSSGLATSWNPNPTVNSSSYYHVWSLVLSGSILYVGGGFTAIGGQSRNALAAVDVTTGLATGWNPNITAPAGVRALALRDTILYAGGNFVTIGGQTRRNIAAVRTTTGLATAWNAGLVAGSQPVYTVALRDTLVYAGGLGVSIGSQIRRGLVAFGGTSGALMPWNPDANRLVRSLTPIGAAIYAGGEFDSIGGQLQRYAAALDPSTGAVLPWNPDLLSTPVFGLDYGTNPGLQCIGGTPSAIYMAGAFYGALAKPHSYLAKATGRDLSPIVAAPATAMGEETATITFTVTASDPDGDAITSLSADVSSLPAGNDATFIPGGGNTTGTFTWHPASGAAGSYPVVFTASNAISGSATTTVEVATLGASGDGKFIWTPGTADIGTHGVVFKAKDAAGDSSMATTQITVSAGSPSPRMSPSRAPGVHLAAMKGPVISAPATAQAVVGSRLEIDVVASNDATSLTADVSALPTGNTSTFTVDHEPIVNTFPNYSWDPWQGTLELPVYVSDPDGDAFTLTADLSSLPPGNSATFTVNTYPLGLVGTVRWAPAVGDSGVYLIKFKAANSLVRYATTMLSIGHWLGGYWRLNGNLLDDASYCNLTGNGVSYGAGHLSQAVRLSGADAVLYGNNYIESPSYSPLYLDVGASWIPGFTTELWVKVGSLSYGDNPVIMWCGQEYAGKSWPNWTLSVCGTGCPAGRVSMVLSDWYASHTWSLQSNVTINDGQWHHVAVTYDKAVLRMYIDGVLDNSLADATISVLAGAGYMRLGRFDPSTYPPIDQFDGWIDELRVWGMARTQAQIQQSMNRELVIPTAVGGSGVPRFVNRLAQNRPNPFNPSTVIEFEVARPGRLSLVIFDAQGRMVKELLDGNVPAGRREVRWDGTDAVGRPVASGVYFYRFESAHFQDVRRMVLLR